MTTKGKNFSLQDVGAFASLAKMDYKVLGGKLFIGNELGLSGCEVSLNCLTAGKGLPFAHSHKQNEELYIVTGGNGIFYIDGSEIPIQEGSLIRVAPAGERSLKAGDQDLYYICIQVKEGSLTQATMQDGVLTKSKASWMKD